MTHPLARRHAFMARRLLAASSRMSSHATNVVWDVGASIASEAGTFDARKPTSMEKASMEKLKTWRRLLADVPLTRVLPKNMAFGVDGDGRILPRAGAETERLAFFGDKVLNQAVALALYAQQARAREDPNHKYDASRGTELMSKLAARACSNQLFARLLPRLLRDEMIAAVPTGALEKGHAHSMGTMVEAAAFLVYAGSDKGPNAIAEVGSFLLAEAEMAEDIHNFKGQYYEIIAKGAKGEMKINTFNEATPEQYFIACASLDGLTSTARGRNKLEAEQEAAKAVLERLKIKVVK